MFIFYIWIIYFSRQDSRFAHLAVCLYVEMCIVAHCCKGESRVRCVREEVDAEPSTVIIRGKNSRTSVTAGSVIRVWVHSLSLGGIHAHTSCILSHLTAVHPNVQQVWGVFNYRWIMKLSTDERCLNSILHCSTPLHKAYAHPQSDIHGPRLPPSYGWLPGTSYELGFQLWFNMFLSDKSAALVGPCLSRAALVVTPGFSLKSSGLLFFQLPGYL